MKKTFPFLLVVGCLFFISCKKEKISNPAPGPASVQKKLVQTTFDESWYFQYNPDGTLKEMSLQNDYKIQMSYSPGKAQLTIMSQGKKSTDGMYTLSNNRPVKYEWTTFNNNGQPTGSYLEQYEYNAKGLLVKMIYSDNSYVEHVYDAGDNLVLVNHFNQLGVQYGKTEYTYGNQKDLFPQFSYLSSRRIGFLFPAMSRMLPVSEKQTGLPGGDVTYHGNISYELDAEGYVVKGKLNPLLPGNSGFEWTNLFQ